MKLNDQAISGDAHCGNRRRIRGSDRFPSAASRSSGRRRGRRWRTQFMNIKALKGHPADQLNPTMVMFEAALGVGCPYCHDNDAAKRELDTKPQKEVARRMIEMVNAVNKNTFGGANRGHLLHLPHRAPVARSRAERRRRTAAAGVGRGLLRKSPSGARSAERHHRDAGAGQVPRGGGRDRRHAKDAEPRGQRNHDAAPHRSSLPGTAG